MSLKTSPYMWQVRTTRQTMHWRDQRPHHRDNHITTTMVPIQATASPIHATAQVPGTDTSSSWHTVAAVFITFFIVLLLASGVGLCHLNRKKTSLEAVVNGLNCTRPPFPNPYPFGSNAWREHELDQVPDGSRDAFRIASLEGQNNMLEQRAEVLEGLIGILEQQNKYLNREITELRLDTNFVVVPEIIQRVYENVHRPVQRPGSEPQGSKPGEGNGSTEGDALKVRRRTAPSADAPADKTSHPSMDFGTDPDPKSMGNHRDTSCSANTARAVISDRPRSLAEELEALASRPQSPSGFTKVSEDSCDQGSSNIKGGPVEVYEMRSFE